MTVLWTKPLNDITEMFIKKFSGSVSKGKSAVNKKQTNKPDKKKAKICTRKKVTYCITVNRAQVQVSFLLVSWRVGGCYFFLPVLLFISI